MDMAELEIDKEDVHDRSKWRKIVNVMKRKTDYKPIIYGLIHPINDSEKDPTRKERAILAQLRSGYCKLLDSYKSRIKKDTSRRMCRLRQDAHDVKHIFACQAHPTTLVPSELWSKPVESIREFSYLEEGSLD